MKGRGLTITFSSAIHHGGGYGISGLVDRSVLRDNRGIPYLAASAIKGKVRHAVLRLLLADGKPACQTGDGESWCGDPDVCALCQLFGSPRRQGTIYFTDAYPAGDTGNLLEDLSQLPRLGGLHRDSETRTRTAVDRRFGTVRQGFLFSTEVLPEFLIFKGALLGNFAGHLDLVRQGCSLITHFGADGARGLGECTISLGERVIR